MLPIRHSIEKSRSAEAPGRRGSIGPLSGITLIELLTVIAIIAILMGLLMPLIGRMMHEGRIIVCASRLHSIGAAMHAYSLDNDGEFADTEDWILYRAGKGGQPWDDDPKFGVRAGKLFPYMGREESEYLCPEFLRVHEMKLHPVYVGRTLYYSYAMNGYFRQKPDTEGNRGWCGYGLLERGHIKSWSSVALFSEENPYVTSSTAGSGPGYNAYPINDPHLGPAHVQYTRDAYNRRVIDGLGNYHRPRNRNLLSGDGYANVLFMDGHLEAVHASRTIEVFTPEL